MTTMIATLSLDKRNIDVCYFCFQRKCFQLLKEPALLTFITVCNSSVYAFFLILTKKKKKLLLFPGDNSVNRNFNNIQINPLGCVTL